MRSNVRAIIIGALATVAGAALYDYLKGVRNEG